jgi:mono/diheme cytochrome c family protein
MFVRPGTLFGIGFFLVALILIPDRSVFSQTLSTGDPVRGKKIFRGLCIQCHGVKGDGNGVAAPALMEKPANFTDPATWKMGDDDFFIHVIRRGRKIMPAFWDVLKPQQIRDVLSYEKTFLKK